MSPHTVLSTGHGLGWQHSWSELGMDLRASTSLRIHYFVCGGSIGLFAIT